MTHDLHDRHRAAARHWLDCTRRPPEVLCGVALDAAAHQRRLAQVLDDVTCRQCHDLLLGRGETIRGRRRAGYFGDSA